MAWTEQWSHKIDGTELNDKVNFITQVPELDNEPDWDFKTVPIDGTYPAVTRADPTSGRYTFLIQMTACTWPVYYSRLATIKGIFGSPNTPHTYLAQVRGMTSPLSTTVFYQGRIVDPKNRQIAVTCYVPVPVLS